MIGNQILSVDLLFVLRSCLFGIYITLTLYHFFIWLGRKKDLTNLSFSLLSFSFAVYLFLLLVVPDISFRPIPNYIFTIMMVCTLPFFYSTLNLMPPEVKSFQVKGSALLAVIGLLSLVYFIITRNTLSSNIFFFSCLLVYTIPANIMGGFFFLKKKMYQSRDLSTFYIGFLFLVLCLLLGALFFGFLSGAMNETVSLVIFNVPFLTILLIFAYALARKFNREHHELNALTENLEQKVAERTAELEEANKQKTRFFVNLAHETKTPLTLISNYIDEYLKTHEPCYETWVIRQNLEKLKIDMVNFLDLEKLKRGQLFYNHEQITDVSQLCKMQTLLYTELAQKGGLQLRSSIAHNVFIKIDPAAWERIVNNLIDNALKYNESGGFIEVALSKEPAVAVLSVTNSGPGISADQQKNIFAPFYQLSHRKRNIQGIGMGLTIIKEILGEVRGTINLESAPGRGAVFHISLERIPESDSDNISIDHKLEIPIVEYKNIELMNEKYDEKRATLFVVEDNRAMVYYFQKKLGDKYNVFYALDGEEALRKIPSLPRLHVIISDVMMEPMDGFEFYDRLAALDGYKAVPFIFLTALTGSSEKLKGLKKGAVDYICKPFHIDELKSKIDSLVRIQAALSHGNLKKLGHSLYNHLSVDSAAVATEAERGRSKKESVARPKSKLKELYRQYKITKRQIEIIALLQIGLERKEICYKLGFTMNTMRTQMKRLFEKCRVYNKTELINIFK